MFGRSLPALRNRRLTKKSATVLSLLLSFEKTLNKAKDSNALLRGKRLTATNLKNKSMPPETTLLKSKPA